MTNGAEDRRANAAPLTDPSASGAASARRFFWLHALVLLVFLGLWTWKLLEPYPVPEAIASQLKGDTQFVAAKGLHACGYAFLTLLAVTLPVPGYWRWFFAGLLALHGVATEIGQTFVPNRTGSVRDVLIDWVGVALGVLVWRARLASGGHKPPVRENVETTKERTGGLRPPLA